MKKVLYFLLSSTLIALLYPISFVYAGSITITDISPSTSISANVPVSLQLNASDFASNPLFTLSDSLPGSTLSNSNINTSGRFSWTPNPLDIGTHEIVFTAKDSYGNKNSATQIITVRPVSPVSIDSLSPGSSVFSGNSLSFSVAALGFSNPSFSINDSFSGTTLSNANISQYGVVNWKPAASDVGVHNITVYVSAAGGRTDSVSQTITVNGISIKNLSSNTVSVGSPITFTINSYGLNSPTYRISDSARNNSIIDDNLTGNNFNWIPKTQDIGTHNISVTATDSNGITSTAQITLTVIENNTPPTPIYIYTNPSPNSSATTNTKTTFTFTKALSLGSKGAEVIELQKRLKSEGYYTGPTNGSFGPLTKAAVMKYQKAKGLSQLGSVGPGTRAALNKK